MRGRPGVRESGIPYVRESLTKSDCTYTFCPSVHCHPLPLSVRTLCASQSVSECTLTPCECIDTLQQSECIHPRTATVREGPLHYRYSCDV